MAAKFSMRPLTQTDFTISTSPELLIGDMINRYLSEVSYWAKGIGSGIVERSIEHSLDFGVCFLRAGIVFKCDMWGHQ